MIWLFYHSEDLEIDEEPPPPPSAVAGMDIETPSPEQDPDDQDPNPQTTADQDGNEDVPEGDPEYDGVGEPEGEENKIEDIITMEPEP